MMSDRFVMLISLEICDMNSHQERLKTCVINFEYFFRFC